MTKIIKKNGTVDNFNPQKIKNAIDKSAERVLVEFSDQERDKIVELVEKQLENVDLIDVFKIHNLVEGALEEVNPKVAKSYRDFRNYKNNEYDMMRHMHEFAENLQFLGDRDNANTDSALVSTQRSLICAELRSEEYKRYFLNSEERQAMKDGYIYIHDRSARLDTMNCCLFRMGDVLKGGFEMANVWYNEPNSLDTAFDVISDVTLSAAAMQYGGFTIPRIDSILVPYAEKSYKKYKEEFREIESLILSKVSDDRDYWGGNAAHRYAMEKVRRDMEQGFQGLEYKFNTVGSSRGDYPFVAISFGIETNVFGQMAASAALKVRKEGQGKARFKKPVLFPKLTFLYDDALHGQGQSMEWLFDEAIDCSRKCMYPDFLSLTGEGYIPSIYKDYGEVISLMGCRASLSPWYREGGMKPANEDDSPVFEGRFNLGAISLHLPMILAKAKEKALEKHADLSIIFYEELEYYLQLIRKIHIKTFKYLANKRASTNPLGYCQGGFLNGHLDPDQRLGEDFLRPMTMSFGITALNELQVLWNGKSIVEDGQFALEVMQYINERAAEFKEEDGILYAIYGTPAESLAGLQIKQFREKYGIIPGVSDREYVSNSFHCGVWEDITPMQKQDLEQRFWNLLNGGKIQYVKVPIDYNVKAVKDLVRRGMEKGFYQGINLSLSYCEDCGYEQLEMDVCPKCGSSMITKINRMNGYLGYTKVHGKTRYNDSKNIEITERVSM